MPVLERLLLPHLPEEGRILDLGCGTGNLARALWERGYQVTAVDVSAGMVREARENAPEVEFVQQDMRTFKRREAFHAVVAMFATVNHLLTVEELRQVLENIRESLRGGGWLLFDFNTSDGLRERWNGMEAVVEEDMVVISQGKYDVERGIATTKITSFRLHGEVWVRMDTEIKMRGYEEDEVRAILEEVGFEEIALHRTTGKRGYGRVFAVCCKSGCA